MGTFFFGKNGKMQLRIFDLLLKPSTNQGIFFKLQICKNCKIQNSEYFQQKRNYSISAKVHPEPVNGNNDSQTGEKDIRYIGRKEAGWSSKLTSISRTIKRDLT
jgi:hypothetical protein